MSDTKFTDGPWDSRIWHGDEWPEERTSIVDSEGRTLFINARYADNVDANAALIAAAPDMYKALEEMIESMESDFAPGYGSEWHIKAIRALGKAGGE